VFDFANLQAWPGFVDREVHAVLLTLRHFAAIRESNPALYVDQFLSVVVRSSEMLVQNGLPWVVGGLQVSPVLWTPEP